jgi:chitinase
MNTWRSFQTTTVSALIAAAALVCLTANAFAPPVDKKAPSVPSNVQVTGNTAWSVSLSWGASTDNSGQLTYKVICNNGQSVDVPQSQTSFTFTDGLVHNTTYSFNVYAFDAAGNFSKKSNTVSSTLPADTTNPSAPVITATDVGPTHIVLSWSATDDDPTLIYRIYKDGIVFGQPSGATSTTAYLLQPETSYTFTAEARDSAGHWSALSEPLTITTPPADSTDITPPTAPSNLWGGSFNDGSTEFDLHWTASTDDVTPQQYIIYDLYINGVYTSVTVGFTNLHEYGVIGENHIELIARDSAGNESEPAVIIFTLP